MSEEPTTLPAGPTPRLGRGGRWSGHPDIDGPVPPAEPYQPKPRTSPPGGWAKTGTAGASTNLSADEEPVTVPVRPYDDAHRGIGQTMRALGSMVPTEAQAAAILAVHDAARRSLIAHAQVIHRAVEAGWRPPAPPAPPAPRRGRLARAIGWFRR